MRGDLEDLLREEAPPFERIEHDLKGGVKRSRINDVKPLQTGRRHRSPIADARAAVREKLDAIGRELEKLVADARKPGTPEHAELSVRASSRLADGISRRAEELKHIRAPDPYHGAPTRERIRQAGEDPRVDVVYTAGEPAGVNHRWIWPVEKAQRQHQLEPAHYLAAARFRNAFDAQRRPGTMGYGDDRRPTDPATRMPITAADAFRQDDGLQLSGRELGFVWARLEPDLKAVVWVLVLEEPLPGQAQALTSVQFGKLAGRTASDDLARWFAFGELKITLVRLASIYKQFDMAVQKEQREKIPA